MIVVDTNLLVYAHRAGVPQHKASLAALEVAASDPRGWGVSVPSIAEFWMVVTHPSSVGGPSTVEEARGFIDVCCAEAGMGILVPGRAFGERLCNLAAQLEVLGPRIFDLQIGLIAQEAGASEIWTHDRRFVAPPGLRVHDPLTRG